MPRKENDHPSHSHPTAANPLRKLHGTRTVKMASPASILPRLAQRGWELARMAWKQNGSTKQDIANEILALLVGQLQSSYMKAAISTTDTGSGLQDNDIAKHSPLSKVV
ncbi:hypothetical protein KEM48_013624 [Puccinia striiformis f. sp. tritici PST-130]|nr:hypothetical protein KEM48_013624 [Puccinia striiformis f. sp. tritici PST-130]